MAARKPRVLYLLQEYPQVSETYIANELEALWQSCDIRIVARTHASASYEDHFPFTVIAKEDHETLAALAAEFRPDIVHAHYLHNAVTAHNLAARIGGAFTVRLHSFDVLKPLPGSLRLSVAAINGPACAGALTFPFTMERMLAAGTNPKKLHAAPPVLRIDRFLDRGPNGNAIMNTGAALPKKNMEAYIDLAAAMPARRFNLYAMGYDVSDLKAHNMSRGNPVRLVPPVAPRAMPGEYKKHEWLVYTASPTINTVGWPMAVAEAQASGVGVVMQDIRPDLREWVGPAGYMFRTIEEAAAIIARPFPAERREAGFAQAQAWDFSRHLGTLVKLWSAALARPRRGKGKPNPA
jgi:glycosyltransferase involved in cell wall biosynthesis